MNRNSQSQLQTMVLMMGGSAAAYVTLQHPAVGTPLLVGVGVITALKVLLERNE